MKTLRNSQDQREILSRLEAVRETSSRQWGKMSAHQMICHLSDSFRGVMGEKSLSMAPWFGRGIAKWFALHVPLQWPKGMKTRPEMDQLVAGTPPAAFARDVAELRRLFERFVADQRDFQWTPHPIFGPMSEDDWMRWGYLHMDHHFRQFGV